MGIAPSREDRTIVLNSSLCGRTSSLAVDRPASGREKRIGRLLTVCPLRLRRLTALLGLFLNGGNVLDADTTVAGFDVELALAAQIDVVHRLVKKKRLPKEAGVMRKAGALGFRI